MNGAGTLLIAVVAFAVGYKLISWLIDHLRRGSSASATTGPARFDPADAAEGSTHPGAWQQYRYEDPETRYARVLGLTQPFTTSEIKERYRTLVASYHPDKTAHLGAELQQMAAQKTREILEAYEYFRVKYRLT
jgi:hypothetical protein